MAVLTGFVVAGGGPSENTVHPTIAAATLVVAGVQLCFSSVLVRLMAEEIHRTEVPESPGTQPGGSLD